MGSGKGHGEGHFGARSKRRFREKNGSARKLSRTPGESSGSLTLKKETWGNFGYPVFES